MECKLSDELLYYKCYLQLVQIRDDLQSRTVIGTVEEGLASIKVELHTTYQCCGRQITRVRKLEEKSSEQ